MRGRDALRTLGYFLIAFLLGITAAAQVRAPERSSPEERERIQQRLKKENEARRNEMIQRRAQGGVRVFEDEEGVPLLTNRGERYSERGDLKEIVIEYDPIVVPNRLRRLSARDKHSASDLADLVRHYARQYALDEHLVFAIIRIESAFDQHAVSSAGARGYMQLMPATAAEMGVRDIFDPAQNIAGGTQYLARMLELFDNNERLALAAYNAGPENVRRYNGIPPFQETRNYVRLVQQYAKLYKNEGIGDADVSPRADGMAHQLASAAADDMYTVHFRSGLSQPAERILEEDNYYYLQYQGRTVPVRKDLVSSIDEPA